jgi:hypothetical protein
MARKNLIKGGNVIDIEWGETKACSNSIILSLRGWKIRSPAATRASRADKIFESPPCNLSMWEEASLLLPNALAVGCRMQNNTAADRQAYKKACFPETVQQALSLLNR